MANGKPGDHWQTDILHCGLPAFSSEVDLLICEAYEAGASLPDLDAAHLPDLVHLAARLRGLTEAAWRQARIAVATIPNPLLSRTGEHAFSRLSTALESHGIPIGAGGAERYAITVEVSHGPKAREILRELIDQEHVDAEVIELHSWKPFREALPGLAVIRVLRRLRIIGLFEE